MASPRLTEWLAHGPPNGSQDGARRFCSIRRAMPTERANRRGGGGVIGLEIRSFPLPAGLIATAALDDAGCLMIRTLGYLEWTAIVIAAFTGLVLWLLLTTPLGGTV